MLILSGESSKRDPMSLFKSKVHIHDNAKEKLSLVNDPPSEVSKKLASYFKFLFVRDPIERLWSAYLSKVYLSWETLLNVPFKYRRNGTNPDDSWTCKYHATFAEFLKMVAYEPERDAHIAPYNVLCQPCAVKYDLVWDLKDGFESLVKLLGKVNASNDVDISDKLGKKPSEEYAVRILNKSMKHYVKKSCGNTSAYANRLWTSLIWRNHIPADAPYPAMLRTGNDVNNAILLQLFHNVTHNESYAHSDFKPVSKYSIINDAFHELTDDEYAKWLQSYMADYKMFGFELPSYLKKRTKTMASGHKYYPNVV